MCQGNARGVPIKGPLQAGPGSLVVSQNVRGDAEQPRSSGIELVAEVAPSFEGAGKRLGGQVLRDLRARSTGEIAIDLLEPSLVEVREPGRVAQ